MTRHYLRPLPDGGPGWARHQPSGTCREPVVVRCAVVWCSSALAMPPGTPEQGQATRLEVAGWRPAPGGGWVCGGAGDRKRPAEPVRVSWWRRWFGGAR